MRQISPIRWYQQLRWRLSLVYVGVTVGLIMAAITAGELFSYFRYQSISRPIKVAEVAVRRAPELAPYVESSPVNTAALALWLDRESERATEGAGRWPGLTFYSNPSVYLAVADVRGTVLAESVEGRPSHGEGSALRFQAVHKDLIQAAVAGETNPQRLSAAEDDGALAAAAPISSGPGRVSGLLFMRIYAPFNWRTHWAKLASGLGAPLLMFIALAFAVGVGFGLVTTRRLVRRLKEISTAANAWGRGDFSASAGQGGRDEVGQLARRLNSMAAELQNVLALRQELAGMEERNRLARDLHDTVKQQVFALGMQIGAAQAMLNGGSPEAHKRLAEAESLVRQIQHELVTIIKELQPGGQQGKGFEQALREHVANWSRQSGVAAEVGFDGGLSLTPEIQHAFLRITQEALSNVARHGVASHLKVQLCHGKDSGVILLVEDNGSGFDVSHVNGGMGLRNMRHRAEALPGGWFQVESEKGKGTRVTAGARPLQEEEGSDV
jgi:NarL family two-component system sensor histidine kinase LiaS